jgi:hypothetical protein
MASLPSLKSHPRRFSQITETTDTQPTRIRLCKEIVNLIANILIKNRNTKVPAEPQMNDATDRSHSEKPIPEERAESEIGRVAEKEVEYEGERFKTSVALLTSKSIKELEGLTFELKGLQEFLKSETERVQREVDNALSGVKVIMDTISPWRNVRPESSVQEKTSRHEPRTQRLTVANGQR